MKILKVGDVCKFNYQDLKDSDYLIMIPVELCEMLNGKVCQLEERKNNHYFTCIFFLEGCDIRVHSVHENYFEFINNGKI